MSFSANVVPGAQLAPGDLVTDDILNAMAQPAVDITGATGTQTIADGSVTTPKLANGVLSADAAGQAKMANAYLLLAMIASGIYTANTAGRAPFATGWLNLNLVGSGIFTATPAGRAPFAGGLIGAPLLQPDAVYYGTGSGMGAAMIVTFSPTLASYVNNSGVQVYTTYWDGLVVAFKAPATCTAGATLKESSLGVVVGIYRQDGTAVQAGDIVSGCIVELRFNASLNSGAGGWQMLCPPPLIKYYRAGGLSVVGNASTTVAFTTAVADTNYRVSFSQQTSAGANTPILVVSSKTVNGFTVTQSTSGGNTLAWDYMVLPNA